MIYDLVQVIVVQMYMYHEILQCCSQTLDCEHCASYIHCSVASNKLKRNVNVTVANNYSSIVY